MTDPARAQLRERLLFYAKWIRGMGHVFTPPADCQCLLCSRANDLIEAASRPGEPEAPAPWQLLKRVREGLEQCRVYTVSFEANGETRRDLGMLRGDAAKAIAAIEAEYPKPAESPVSAREPEAPADLVKALAILRKEGYLGLPIVDALAIVHRQMPRAEQ